MTRRVLKAGERPTCDERMTFSKLLNRLAASPWALSCTSFAVTALLIQSNGLGVF